MGTLWGLFNIFFISYLEFRALRQTIQLVNCQLLLTTGRRAPFNAEIDTSADEETHLCEEGDEGLPSTIPPLELSQMLCFQLPISVVLRSPGPDADLCWALTVTITWRCLKELMLPHTGHSATAGP